jgi:hypothetical protein
MAEFKIGDRVTALASAGEIAYGPFRSTFGVYEAYVVRLDDGRERAHRTTDLTVERPAFAVGDVVTISTRPGARATVEYGPYGVNDGIYVVKLVDPPTDTGNPRTFQALASVLKKVTAPALVPVGTRVRVDRAKYAEHTHGMMATVVSNTETFREDLGDIHVYRVRLDNGGRPFAAEVTPLDDVEPATTYTSPAGITYDLTAKYTDGDDVWSFTGRRSPDGVPRVTAYGNQDNVDTIDETEKDFGPLRKVGVDAFEHLGVSYEYGATYEDRDGDTWRFERSSVHGQPVSDAGSWSDGEGIGYIVGNFGPLKKQ